MKRLALSMALSSPPIPSISSIPLSLHWLSQVPNLLRKEAKIGDDDKGNVYATSISPPSYAKQFKQDFKLFLSSRSKELVPQGGMLLAFLGRYDASEYISIPGIIRMALNDLVSEKKVMKRVKPILEESLNKVYGTTNVPTCFKVADLGCSSGPNTLLLASNIIHIVIETSRRLKVEPPMFQFFLNDLFGNDFNSIFKSLPQFYDTLKQEDTTCFMNATPGTFYGTLFPSNSIHFFHSSFSLHWLSQVPNLLREEAKIANDDKRNIYATSIIPPSYGKQFELDFKLFLVSRYKELVPGGGMLLTFLGKFDTSEYISVPGIFRVVLNDMVSENLIEEAKLEHFNMPVYFAPVEKVREIIEEEGSFCVERLEIIKLSWDGSSLDEEAGIKGFKDDNERAEFITRNKRSILEPLLKAHFGEGILDELFLRLKNRIIQFLPKLEDPILVISLTKIA